MIRLTALEYSILESSLAHVISHEQFHGQSVAPTARALLAKLASGYSLHLKSDKSRGVEESVRRQSAKRAQ